MKRQSTFALVLSFTAATMFVLFAFGPTSFRFFEDGEELILGSVMGLGALMIATLPFFNGSKRTKLSIGSLVLATIIFALWTVLSLVFRLAYSSCPGGVC